ncbi:MAG: enoyl-CoA hydratase/isomerase family protein [Planctomycetes bacterium]|nr:enoyl-CoA hydratase/isomerase family protein [Planctomycetota bacterium]
MNSDTVQSETRGPVTILTLNRPEARNAMSADLLAALRAAAAEVSARREVRAVVITGAGGCFSSGADFGTLAGLVQEAGVQGPMGVHAAIRALYEALLSVESIPVPTIAAVNGAAVGAGLGLALLCDLRIVAEDARVGVNFTRLGIHPGLGLSHLLTAAVGYERAAELVFTGELVRGAEAAAMGLAREAVSAAEVLPRALELAARVARAAPLAVRQARRSLRLAAGRDAAWVRELESFAQALLGQTADAREGVQAMLERREPEFQGR